MAEVLFRARLTRDDSATPWGFRLQGGADYKKPLTLLKVVDGSVAAKSGLHATDIVVKLAGQSADGMTHKGAQEAIMASGNALEIIVERADVTISSPPNTPQPQKAARKLTTEKRPESPAKKVATENKLEESRRMSPTQSQSQPASQPLSQSPPQQSIAPPNKPIAGPPIGVPSIALPPLAIPTIIAGSALATDTSSDSNLYIPDSNNNQQLAESLERGMFVKDPAEFQVNPFHKPGARRTSSPNPVTAATAATTVSTARDDDTSSDPSSSGSTDSLDSVPEDGASSLPTHQVPEEKLLATKDDAWSTMRRSSRSPVPPGGEAWRREEQEHQRLAQEDAGAASQRTQLGGESGATEGVLDVDEEGGNRAGTYSEVSTTEVKLVTVIEQPPRELGGSGDLGRGEGGGYSSPQGQDLLSQTEADNTSIVYPWRLAGRRASSDELVVERSSGGPHMSSNRRAWETLERSHDFGGGDVSIPTQVPGGGGIGSTTSHVDGDEVMTSEGDYDADDMTTPSLMFVGRRLAPSPGAGPDASTSSVPSTTVTSSPSPHISVTPSSPPTGLTVLPLLQYQQHHLPTTTTTTSDNSPSSPHHPPPYDLPQLSRDMSEIQLEALRLMSNNEYHSPRLEDIHFSTGGPEVVDISMPAVKEMVEDLNRRLEAIAAQQPRIAQPPTAQELGLSYIRQRRKELEQEQEEQESAEREIFIDMPPAPSVGGAAALEAFAHQGYFRNTSPYDAPPPPPPGAATTNAYQKLYDIASPIHSPRGWLEAEARGPSPRNQRRVHFAEPPEQSVIEIEARSKRRGHRKDKDRLENELPALPSYSSHSLPETLNGSHRYSVPTSMVSSPPLMTYESSSLPVMIERPAGAPRRALSLPHPSSPVPGGYESPQHPFTSAPSPSGGSAGHPAGQFSVSITHKKADQSMPTRLAFTLPSGQPGQPTHFRYTMAGTHSPQQQQQLQQQLQQQQQHSRSDAGLTYSLPPRYEDSVKALGAGGVGGAYGRRSFDDSYLPRPGSHHLMYRTSAGRAVSPQPSSYHPRRHPSPLYVDTAGGPLSPPRASPIYTPVSGGAPRGRAGAAGGTEPYVNPIRGMSPSVDDAVQSKSFRALEAHYTDGGQQFDTSRVQILGTPSQGGHENVPDHPPTKPYVLQPAAMGRPFNQLQPMLPSPEVRPYTPPPPQGALPGPPPPGVDLAGAAIGPGLFALFDSSFTDKFMQWEQSPRSHFESETYKLVHEMEGGGSRKPGRGGKY